MTTYHLGYVSTIGVSTLENFMRSDTKITEDLTSIPKIGEKTAKVMKRKGVKTAFELVAALSDRGFEWDACYNFMKENCPKGALVGQILVILMFKLGRSFDIPEPPAHWETDVKKPEVMKE